MDVHSPYCVEGWIDAPDTRHTTPCPVHRPAQFAALHAADPGAELRSRGLDPDPAPHLTAAC